MVEVRPERHDQPLTTTDQYLAAILDELRTIRGRLVQEPQNPPPPGLLPVAEPATQWTQRTSQP